MTELTGSTGLTDLTLANGMRVLLQPLPGCQVVATCLHVGTGFRNEPVAGAAHLLEHVLVQGSTADGPLTAAVTAMGGTMNARTSADHTQYTQILPADGLELGLRIERDRLTGPDLSRSTSAARSPSSRRRSGATCSSARTAAWSCSTSPSSCTTPGRTGTTATATSGHWSRWAPRSCAPSSSAPTHPATSTSRSSATSTPTGRGSWWSGCSARCRRGPPGSASRPSSPR